MVLIGLLPGAAILVASSCYPEVAAFIQSVAAEERLSTFASTGASFAFTLLGFITGVLALFVTFKDSTTFQIYRQEGFLVPLLWFLLVTMVVLAASFFLSMRLFFGVPSPAWTAWAVASLASAVWMTILTMLPFVLLQFRACSDEE